MQQDDSLYVYLMLKSDVRSNQYEVSISLSFIC